MNETEQLRRYREEMGDQAAMRQVISASNHLRCCGQLFTEGHHPDCPNHKRQQAARKRRKEQGAPY